MVDTLGTLVTMYCVTCYIANGKGTEDAPYLYDGKSLCNSHLWATVGLPTPAEIEAPTNGKAVKVAKPSSRGRRIPTDYVPAPATIETIRNEYPGVTDDMLRREHRVFCDYWNGVAGAKAVKRDWEATWRNWMRRSFNEMAGSTRARAASTVDDKAMDYQSMREPE